MMTNNDVLMMNDIPLEINMLNSIQLCQQLEFEDHMQPNKSTSPSPSISLSSSLQAPPSLYLPPLQSFIDKYNLELELQKLISDADIHGNVAYPLIINNNSFISSFILCVFVFILFVHMLLLLCVHIIRNIYKFTILFLYLFAILYMRYE